MNLICTRHMAADLPVSMIFIIFAYSKTYKKKYSYVLDFHYMRQE